MSKKIVSARICGVSIPMNKPLYIGLSYIFGIGIPLGRKICDAVNIMYNMRVYDMTEDQLAIIRKYIQDNKIVTEGDLQREIQQNIKLQVAISSYRGYRHKLGLPVHGQRTRTNSRTRKGPRNAVKVANKK